MADEHDQILSTEAEDELLTVETDPKEKTPTDVHPDPMFSMMQNVNRNLGAMADSMIAVQQSLKRLHSSHTDEQIDPKRRKHCSRDEMSASDGSEHDGEDSDADLQALCGTEADGISKDKPRAPLEQNDGSNDPLLSEIAEDFLNADDSGPAIEKQLADFINNLWSKKLPDSKLKDKSAKYLRPANCETLTTPRVNPEIWDKLSHSVKQQDLRSSSIQKTIATAGAAMCKSIGMLLEMKNSKQPKSDSDIQKLVKVNTDAVALLGHAHIDLSHRRRESLKPHLNKDYAGLCASHVPVTAQLFGNDLQTQLNNIRASNRVSSTAVGNRHKNSKGHPSRNYQKFDQRSKPFLAKGCQWNSKPLQKPFFRQQDQGKKQQ